MVRRSTTERYARVTYRPVRRPPTTAQACTPRRYRFEPGFGLADGESTADTRGTESDREGMVRSRGTRTPT